MKADSSAERSVMDLARELEESFDWLGAAEVYEKAVAATPDIKPDEIGDLLEREAYALHKAAFKAEASDHFRDLTQRAIECCTRARKAYESKCSVDTTGCRHRCVAMIDYLNYMVKESLPEKKECIENSWKEAKASLSFFEETGKHIDFAQTFIKLSYAVAMAFNHDRSGEGRERKMREALTVAEKSIRCLAGTHYLSDLAKAHVKAAGLIVQIQRDFTPLNEMDRADLDAWNHWLKANEASEEDALREIPYLMVLQGWPSACRTEERLSNMLKALDLAKSSGDQFVTGMILDGLSQRRFTMANSTDDVNQKEALVAEGFSLAKESKMALDRVSFISPNVSKVWTAMPSAGYYFNLVTQEKDREELQRLLVKAHEPCEEQVKLALESGYPDVENAANLMLGVVLRTMGRFEADADRKKALLERALSILSRLVTDDQRIHSDNSYLLGTDLAELAEAHYEMARIEVSSGRRRELLLAAISRLKESVSFLEKEFTATQDTNPDASSEIAAKHATVATWTSELHKLTGEERDLRHMAEAYEKAVHWCSKAGVAGRCAEGNWKAAQAYDELGEFQRASERFELASEDYRKAAENVPRLKELYEDHVLYMRAWAEIERAKYHHHRQEPGQAKQAYEKASEIHRSTKRWHHLAGNYSAWAQIEEAEELSRTEKCTEAVAAFKRASELLLESKKVLHGQLARIDDLDEKQVVRKLEQVADIRSAYCSARIQLEQARLLDMRGDLKAASETYLTASGMFDDILKDLESDQDRRECQLISSLSRAWAVMAQAEAESSPEKYAEAAKLFEAAKDISLADKGKLMALGHSRFCSALELGTRFYDTGDLALNVLVNQNLDSAANYYSKAGLTTGAEYAKASKLLFEGYVHLRKANLEDSHTDKAKLYAMAEKLFEASISSFAKASQPGKAEQVKSLLQRTREEKRLAVSLNDILHAPDLISSTEAFTTPSPTFEKAVGVEGFESANLHALCSVSKKELRVGEEFEVEVELSNAGRSTADLTSLEGAVPTGFEITRRPEKSRLEGANLVIKGRSIAPMKTEDISIMVKATTKGSFHFRPVICYTDESGSKRTCTADGPSITVKELGISGWLKGPERSRQT
jgi:hypothetical protein